MTNLKSSWHWMTVNTGKYIHVKSEYDYHVQTIVSYAYSNVRSCE